MLQENELEYPGKILEHVTDPEIYQRVTKSYMSNPDRSECIKIEKIRPILGEGRVELGLIVGEVYNLNFKIKNLNFNPSF